MGWIRRRGHGSPAAIAAALACALTIAGCGRSAGATNSSGNVSPTRGLVTTTAPGAKPVSSVVWAVYRDVNSLDPIFAFDYPENTAISLMCESLLLAAPYDPTAGNLSLSWVGPAGGHLLGYDAVGRDVLSRLLAGATSSMLGP